ncbi:hypothetical protein SAMN05444146_1210 [Flavobacterium johnsoniae]|jgi:hypothetical protein|nr:hypothetical protein SAMN05444146_1210 [Flavobacterium johnsoniae]
MLKIITFGPIFLKKAKENGNFETKSVTSKRK